MEPVPEGGVLVDSFPHGAGRRGRRKSHDWDKIVAWHRANPHAKVGYGHVKAGSVGTLRKNYPDVTFLVFGAFLARPDQEDGPTKVCTLYVTYTGAGTDGESES